MVYSSADGLLKLLLLVIVKSAKPRACRLRNLKNEWMNSSIFDTWFKENIAPEIQQFFKKRNLRIKVVLLRNNCSAHAGSDVLSSDGI